MLVYIDKIKSSLLSHTLTPLDDSLYPSLKSQQQQQQQRQTQSTNSSSTPEITNYDDVILPQPDSNPKRSQGATDTNEEDELEDEYYDTSPPSKKLRTATDSQKKRLFDPRNMLGDMLPPSMSLNSQLSTIPRSNTQNSLQHDPEPDQQQQQQQQQSTEGLSMLSVAASIVESTSTDAANEDTKDTMPSQPEDMIDIDSVASDMDEGDDTQVSNVSFVLSFFLLMFFFKQKYHRWQCFECQFSNAGYLQTCDVCHTYRKKDIPSPFTGPTATATAAVTVDQNEKDDYKLTVAGENNTMDLPASSSTRRRTEKPQGEAHILYTGLTPADEVNLCIFFFVLTFGIEYLDRKN